MRARSSVSVCDGDESCCCGVDAYHDDPAYTKQTSDISVEAISKLLLLVEAMCVIQF